MSDSSPEKPQEDIDATIHVDEDWKNQVRAEKEAFRQLEADDREGAGGGGAQMPEASFSLLVTTLATQATVALGQMAAPDGEEMSVDLTLAKHLIDTLEVLEQKTKGNLTPDESAMLTNVLHQLRMLYVHIHGKAGDRPKKSSIELP